MSRVPTCFVLASFLSAAPAYALTLSDSLSDWRAGSAMEHVRLATKLSKSFIGLNESLTSDYFLRCIDDVSTYANFKSARVEDAVRECVSARMHKDVGEDE